MATWWRPRDVTYSLARSTSAGSWNSRRTSGAGACRCEPGSSGQGHRECRPVIRMQQPGFGPQHRAPTGPAILGPHAHPVKPDLAAGRIRTGCGYRHLLRTRDHTCRCQQRLETIGSGHLDLVPELGQARNGRLDLPRQAQVDLGPRRGPRLGLDSAGQPRRWPNLQRRSRASVSSGHLLEGGGRGPARHDQPLTEPAVVPDTICRWKKMNRTSGGMVISSTSANSRFHCVVNWLWKLYRVSCTVALSLPGRK